MKKSTILLLTVVSLGLTSCIKLPNFNDIEWVDMGLPSGTKWARCNVDAESPEDAGAFFAWGEKTNKKDYSWGTYKYSEGDYNNLTKYCNKRIYFYQDTNDWLTQLELDDDIGGEYKFAMGFPHMPSKEDWVELLENTNKEWVTLNGVSGCQLTSKGNGNTLFFPAGGYYWGRTHYYDGTGSLGMYWASDLDTSYAPNAFVCYFGEDDSYVGSSNRFYGYAIRLVN